MPSGVMKSEFRPPAASRLSGPDINVTISRGPCDQPRFVSRGRNLFCTKELVAGDKQIDRAFSKQHEALRIWLLLVQRRQLIHLCVPNT